MQKLYQKYSYSPFCLSALFPPPLKEARELAQRSMCVGRMFYLERRCLQGVSHLLTNKPRR